MAKKPRIDPARVVPVLRVSAGIFFVVLGLLGLVLPVLQGLLFLAIGFGLLSPYVPLLRQLRARLHRRFPWLNDAITRHLKRARRNRSR